MLISQKCRYAVRAIYELARQYDTGPVKIGTIATAQSIPIRFLEVILNQLKHGGFVRSLRGARGGYYLARSPDTLKVGEVIGFIQGPVDVVDCDSAHCGDRCPLYGNCVFRDLWNKLERAISDVYDSTNFQNLLEQQDRKPEPYIPMYVI
jgi:Rrf2 family transcriptional regulator, cysteine metabolism repressor